MRTIELDGTSDQFRALISDSARADYVYMYPPRQAYRFLDPAILDPALSLSLARPGPLNLYFHFPFCAQVCAFCNLFTVNAGASSESFRYLTLLKRELDAYAPLIQGRVVDTIYLGGGTPSMLPAEHFSSLFDRLRQLGICEVTDVPEVAIEMSPETAVRSYLLRLRQIGVNRVNLGVQSSNNAELRMIGRSYLDDTPLTAINTALDVGFDNVCVDLIYGLQGQSNNSWERSVDAIASLRPHTICAYPLTLRPRTGFSARGYVTLSDQDQYARYDYVDNILRAHGYNQETHVRWALPGGGYRQKANHWAGQDVVGLGAGARGYLWHIDYRNGYSVRSRQGALRSWARRVEEYGHGRCDGFLMDHDERIRKSVILGLNDLSRDRFQATHNSYLDHVFRDQLAALAELSLITDDGYRIKLTRLGTRFRDVVVQLFFSQRVHNLIASFDYNE